MISLIVPLASCSPRIYRPPALGAEYRFDEGLKSSKHRSHLFDKKTRKALQEKGILDAGSNHSSGTPFAKTTSATKNTATVSDSAGTDTLTTPAAVTSPALSDSSQSGPR